MIRQSVLLGMCAVLLAACGPGRDDDCTLVNPSSSGGLFPQESPGATSCVRSAPLVESNSGEVLPAVSAYVGQTHCEEILVMFYDTRGSWCGFEGNRVATLYFVAQGSGTYEATGDDLTCERGPNGEVIGIPPGQDPWGAEGSRDGASLGIGEAVITSNAGLDAAFTVGSVDIAYDDGTRLLADFSAPLCVTE